MIEPVFLDDTSFWDVVLWMVWFFFLTLAIAVFIAIFSDIFRRHDLSGLEKALWTLLIFLLPFFGVLIYMIVRPFTIAPDALPADPSMGMAAVAASGGSPSEQIAKAHDLLQKGALTQEEFDKIKAKALS